MSWRFVVGVVRVVGFVVLGVWAASVCFRSEIVFETGVSRTSEIELALEDYRKNESSADSAPKQDVVNGWVARDLLETIARSVNDLSIRSTSATEATDFRLSLLVTIAILALCWHGLTLPAVRLGERISPPPPPPALTPPPDTAPGPVRTVAHPNPQAVTVPVHTPPQPQQPPSADGTWSTQWPAR